MKLFAEKVREKNEKDKEKNSRNSVSATAAPASAGAILLALAVCLQLAARRIPGFGSWYALRIYPALVGTLGRISGLFPFSLVEFGLYGLILGILLLGIKNIRRPLRILEGLLLVVGLLAFSYTACCGVNYYRNSFADAIGLRTAPAGTEELQALCETLAVGVGENVPEESMGRGSTEQRSAVPTVRTQIHQSVLDMEALSKDYPALAGFYPDPKPVTVSEILSYQGLTGVYAPFTVEANFNADMTAYNMPLTLCHELSHLRGFMQEQEANFIGWLACIHSDSDWSRYSGYLSGFVYAANALVRQNPEAGYAAYAALPDRAKRDLAENNTFWDRYEGKITEVSTKVNDTYLKANSQSAGVASYGMLVDLMLAYYREN